MPLERHKTGHAAKAALHFAHLCAREQVAIAHFLLQQALFSLDFVGAKGDSLAAVHDLHGQRTRQIADFEISLDGAQHQHVFLRNRPVVEQAQL